MTRRLAQIAATPALALSLVFSAPLMASADNHGAAIETTVTAKELPGKKQTETGLYITAAESGALLDRRDDVVLIDVRSPEETMLVGYPGAADVNIPFKLIDPTHPFNAKKGRYEMMQNPSFIPAAKAYIQAADPEAVLIMCRSGGRSAQAVDALTAAGLDLPLYSVVDGFEGDKSDAGKRSVNGWKNAGLDWTYKVREGYWPAAE
ncbi:sulfurtransferase [Roseovarius sp. TE539]|uniref:rhodanese-like domain-containing protein n=1 Tax=Roseovarius sp. TE539 TaxID=2249812 RepID=UPI000DDC96B2|nr:rhodanese-like domain-containing protein [Roseovarius sp. TE539]RBI75183.1 sulfurtransferase [Roseovarius sp. TE539]